METLDKAGVYMNRKPSIMETKHRNKVKIVKFIYKKGETSKQEISRELGLSMPTVLQNVKELLERGIVIETGKYQSTGGRKAGALSLAKDHKYAVGIDVTRNHISMVLVDTSGTVSVYKRSKRFYEDSVEYYESLGVELDSFLAENHIDKNKVLGVGLSIPGIVDTTNSILLRTHVFQVSNLSLKKFSQFLKYEVAFSNDANSAAYAELKEAAKNSIYLSLSNTVGGAVYIHDNIYMGDNYKSAEFGHMVIEPGGRTCYCGKKGCMDAYCSAQTLSKYTDDNLDLFFLKLKEGNAECMKAWQDYLDYLAISIANLRMAFDCDIILGGYLGGYLEDYLAELGYQVMKYNNFDIDTTYIKSAAYKKEAAAVGAGIQFIEKYFDSID